MKTIAELLHYLTEPKHLSEFDPEAFKILQILQAVKTVFVLDWSCFSDWTDKSFNIFLVVIADKTHFIILIIPDSTQREK